MNGRRVMIAACAGGALVLAAVGAVAMVSCHPPAEQVAGTRPVRAVAPIVDGGAPHGDGAVAAAAGAQAQPPAPKPRPAKVKIVLHTIPNKAKVSWGKKLLGVTPLTIERPRDSGPLDLTVRQDGYFPIHTRLYSYKNDTLWLKMTRLEDRMSLFGAKKELPPPELPDGGAPPAPAAAPAVPPTPVAPRG